MQGTWPKVVIAIVVLLVILFVVGIGVGVGNHSDSSGSGDSFPPGWVQNVGDVVARPQPLTADDFNVAVPPDCKGRDRITIRTKTCLLNIKSLGGFVGASARTLDLTKAQGAMTLTFAPAPDDKGKQNHFVPPPIRLPGASEKRLDVYKEGGTLTIACTAPTTCTLPL